MTTAGVVIVNAAVLSAMQSAGAHALPAETGGILCGFRTAEGVVVTRAVVVPDDTSSGHHYVRDEVAANAALSEVRAAAPPVVGYVGEWHTHPADQPPSGLDKRTLINLARDQADLVALVVLPYTSGVPQPAHAVLGVRTQSRAPVPRGRAIAVRAQLVVEHTTSEDLERRADGAVSSSTGPSSRDEAPDT